MTEVEQQAPQNGIDLSAAEEDDNNKSRPADIEQDMREMERRKRVEAIMSSKLFREELERIVDSARESGTSGILQQLSDIVGVPANRVGSIFKTSNCMVPINDIRGVESMGYAKGEKILRCKLAATFRLLDLYGWTQGLGALISARLKVDQEYFLVNPYGLMYHEITASSLNKVDMQGNIIEQGTTNFGVNKSHFVLHSVVHAARPDIRCAIYVGCTPVVAVSSLKTGLLPLTKDACVLGEISTHHYTGTLDNDERDTLVRNLGPNSKIMLLTNHGALCCGETIEEAFHAACHIVQACETQLKLLPVGLDNLVLIPEESRKQIYEQSRRPPEDLEKKFAATVSTSTQKEQDSTEKADETATTLKTTIAANAPKWRVGGAEFEALMRMLDNAGYRTGYIYRHPLIKSDPPKPKNDVELPPAVSSLGYLLEEEELFRQGIWKRGELRKGGDRSRWLNSPNVYQKVEVLETGTPDPKKITKWVAEGSPTHSTPVRIEDALQFVPANTNPKEFKRLQQQIKDNRRADKISAGPQSHILEGVTWDEANRIKDATVSQTGDHVVLMGAASKGIIQRGFQHNATVYKAPYAKNPFDNVTDDELNEYKRTVERKKKSIHGEYTDTDFSESEALSSQVTSGAQQTKQTTTSTTAAAVSQSEPEDVSEHQVMRIQTQQAPVPSQPEVVLSDDALNNQFNDKNLKQDNEKQDQDFNSTSTTTNDNLDKDDNMVGGINKRQMIVNPIPSGSASITSANSPINPYSKCSDSSTSTPTKSSLIFLNLNQTSSPNQTFVNDFIDNDSNRYSGALKRNIDFNHQLRLQLEKFVNTPEKYPHDDKLPNSMSVNTPSSTSLLSNSSNINNLGIFNYYNSNFCKVPSVQGSISDYSTHCCSETNITSNKPLTTTNGYYIEKEIGKDLDDAGKKLSCENSIEPQNYHHYSWKQRFANSSSLNATRSKSCENFSQDHKISNFCQKHEGSDQKDVKVKNEKCVSHNCNTPLVCEDILTSLNQPLDNNLIYNIPFNRAEAPQSPVAAACSPRKSRFDTPCKRKICATQRLPSGILNRSPYRTVSHFGFNSPQRAPKPEHKHIPTKEPKNFKAMRRSASFEEMFSSPRYADLCDNCFKNLVRSKPELFKFRARLKNICGGQGKEGGNDKERQADCQIIEELTSDCNTQNEIKQKSVQNEERFNDENSSASSELCKATCQSSDGNDCKLSVDEPQILQNVQRNVNKYEASDILEPSTSSSSFLGRIYRMNFSNVSSNINFGNETPRTVSSNITIDSLESCFLENSSLKSKEEGKLNNKSELYKDVEAKEEFFKTPEKSSRGNSETKEDNDDNLLSIFGFLSPGATQRRNVTEIIDFGNWPSPLNISEEEQESSNRDNLEQNSSSCQNPAQMNSLHRREELIRRRLIFNDLWDDEVAFAEGKRLLASKRNGSINPETVVRDFVERSSTPTGKKYCFEKEQIADIIQDDENEFERQIENQTADLWEGDIEDEEEEDGNEEDDENNALSSESSNIFGNLPINLDQMDGIEEYDDSNFREQLLNLCNSSEHFTTSVLDVIFEESGEEDEADIYNKKHDEEVNKQNNSNSSDGESDEMSSSRTKIISKGSHEIVDEENLEMVVNVITEAVIINLFKEQGIISRHCLDKVINNDKEPSADGLINLSDEKIAAKGSNETLSTKESIESDCSARMHFAKCVFDEIVEECTEENCQKAFNKNVGKEVTKHSKATQTLDKNDTNENLFSMASSSSSSQNDLNEKENLEICVLENETETMVKAILEEMIDGILEEQIIAFNPISAENQQNLSINESKIDLNSKSSDSTLTFVIDTTNSNHTNQCSSKFYDDESALDADDEMEASGWKEKFLSKKVVKFLRSKSFLKNGHEERGEEMRAKLSKNNKKAQNTSSSLEWYVNLFSPGASDADDEQASCSTPKERAPKNQQKNSPLHAPKHGVLHLGIVPFPENIDLTIDLKDIEGDIDSDISLKPNDTITFQESPCTQLADSINAALDFDFDEEKTGGDSSEVSSSCCIPTFILKKSSSNDDLFLRKHMALRAGWAVKTTIEQLEKSENVNNSEILKKSSSFPELRFLDPFRYNNLILREASKKPEKPENPFQNGRSYDCENADCFITCESLKNTRFFRSSEGGSCSSNREKASPSKPNETSLTTTFCGTCTEDFGFSGSDLLSDEEESSLSMLFRHNQHSTDKNNHFYDNNRTNEKLALPKNIKESSSVNKTKSLDSIDQEIHLQDIQEIVAIQEFDQNPKECPEKECFANTFVTVRTFVPITKQNSEIAATNFSNNNTNDDDDHGDDELELTPIEREVLDKIEKNKLAEDEEIFEKIQTTIRNKLTPKKLEEFVKKNQSFISSSEIKSTNPCGTVAKGSVLQKAKMFQTSPEQQGLLKQQSEQKPHRNKITNENQMRTWPPKSNNNDNKRKDTLPLRSSRRGNIDSENSPQNSSNRKRNFILENIRNVSVPNKIKRLQGSPSAIFGPNPFGPHNETNDKPENKGSLKKKSQNNDDDTNVFSFQSRLVRGSPSFWVSLSKTPTDSIRRHSNNKNDTLKAKTSTFRKGRRSFSSNSLKNDISDHQNDTPFAFNESSSCSSLILKFSQSPNTTLGVDNEIAALGEQIQQLHPRLNAYEKELNNFGENLASCSKHMDEFLALHSDIAQQHKALCKEIRQHHQLKRIDGSPAKGCSSTNQHETPQI